MGDPRRLAITAFLLCLCLLQRLPCQAQKERDASTRPGATLFLNVDAKRNTASLTLALADAPTFPTTEPDQKRAIDRLFAAMTGNATEDTDLYRSEDGDEEQEPGEWTATTQIKGQTGKGLRRTGLLVSGQLNLLPLRAFLLPLHRTSIAVHLVLAKEQVPFAECRGLDLARRGRREERFQKQFSLATLPAEPIRFAVGYRTADLVRIYVPLMCLLLIPPALALVLQRYALAAQNRFEARRIQDGPTHPGSVNDPGGAIWLGCFRLLGHGTTLFSLVWLSAALAAKPENAIRWYFAADTAEARTALTFLLIVLPPTILQLISILILRPVYARLKSTEITVTEIVLQTGGQLILSILPVMFTWIGINSFIDSGLLPLVLGLGRSQNTGNTFVMLDLVLHSPPVYRGVGWLALAATLRWLLQTALPLLNRHHPIALTSGPIHDRVAALAEKAGVLVRQTIYLSTGWDKMANAFAVKGNYVVLTDRLLQELSRDEVDAVLAHELAHLKHRHPFWQGIIGGAGFMLIVGVPLLISVTGIIPFALYGRFYYLILPLMIGIGIVIQMAISRRWEKVADTTAVRWIENPAALITGLTRLSRINGAPEEWNRWEEKMMTHPSTRRRAAYLAAGGAVQPAQMETLLRETTGEAAVESERYPLPVTDNAQLVFSVEAQTRSNIATVYFTLINLVLLPGITALIAETAVGDNRLLRLLVYGIGVAAVLLLAVYRQKYRTQRATMRLEARLRQRLRAAGLLPFPDEAIHFVGIAPTGPPRYFNGRLDIEQGYLILDGEHLRFVGEQFQFTVPRASLLRPTLAGLWPGWWPQPRIALSWPDTENENRPGEKTMVTIHALGGLTLAELQRKGYQLLAFLQAWKEDGKEVPESTMALPRLALTGGVLLTELYHPKQRLIAARSFTIAAVAFCLLANLPWGATLYTLSVVPGIFLIDCIIIRRQLDRVATPPPIT